MVVRVSAWFLISIAASSPASALSDQVRRGPTAAWVKPSALLPVPPDAGGLLFMRRQDMEIHFSDEGQAQYLGYRIKILHPNALALGNISLAWNPTAGAPVVHEIKIIRGNLTVDVLKNSSFEILRREDQLEAARLDGTLTAVLRIPDLRVGDELEVDITSFSNDPNLAHHETGILKLADDPAPGRYHIGLSWDPGHAPKLKPTSDIRASMQMSERAADFRFENPASASPPTDAPPRYLLQRAIEFSDFTDWSAVSSHFAAIYTKAALLSPNSPIKGEAHRIAAAQADPVARASAALKLVQQDVRYIYVGLNGGNLKPASADETWQRRYGDCKGKTALLLALLSELGIEAEPVLVNSSGDDDGLNQHLPIIQYFDHVLARARINGSVYWLDGTLPPVAPPSLKPVYPLKWVLPLTNKGSSLQKLEWQPNITPDELSLYEIDARPGFDKPAHIVTTQIVRGIKGLQQQIQFSAATHAQLLDIFRQHAIGEAFQQIEDVQWHYDQKAGASVLTVSGTGTVSWEDDGNGAKSLALPGGGFNPPDRRVRAAGSGQGVPFYTKPEYSCNVTTVRLPTTTQAKQWSAKPSFDTLIFGRHYHRAWELRDGTIRMVRSSRVDQPEIDESIAQRDNGRISSFDNSMGNIFYDPSSQKSVVGNGEKVPATFDYDWTSEIVPCLTS